MIKTVRIVFLAVLSLAACGCITNKATSLSSLSMESVPIPVNPALSLPDRGFHPYVGVGVSDTEGYQTGRDSIENARSVSLSAGFNWHDSIEEPRLALPFFGLSLSGSVISYDPKFLDEEQSAIESAGIDISGDHVDYSAELGAKAGLLLRYQWLLVSTYLQGMVKYEDGSYAALRRKVDGTEMIYNLVDNPWIYGYSLGVDVQGGTADRWDVGFSLAIANVFNETQSVSWDYIQENVDSPFSNGSDSYLSMIVFFGPYVDYRNFRLSVAVIDMSSVSAQIAWRF